MDIKYITTHEGKLYLNIIRDVYSQAIIAYKISDKMDYQTLVKPCLDSALKLFKFNVNNLILHTDNGIQYRCYQFYQFTKFYNIKTSKSKPGVSTDNGFAENFFSHLSAE